MDCPENRCPICWSNDIDSLKTEDGDYCEEHEEEL